jgi:hypothetical protein
MSPPAPGRENYCAAMHSAASYGLGPARLVMIRTALPAVISFEGLSDVCDDSLPPATPSEDGILFCFSLRTLPVELFSRARDFRILARSHNARRRATTRFQHDDRTEAYQRRRLTTLLFISRDALAWRVFATR